MSGQVDEATGMVCNLVDLDGFVQQRNLERFDLQNLNTLAEFKELVPTTENLSMVIYEIMQRGFHLAHLEKVRIEETMMNSFEYAGGEQSDKWRNAKLDCRNLYWAKAQRREISI